MAADDLTNEERDTTVAKKGNGVVKIILIVLVVLVLVIASIGATLFFAGVIGGSGKAEHVEQSVDQNQGEKAARKKSSVNKIPVYYAFEPAFVVNFNDGKSIRYLQLSIEVMTYDELVVEDIKIHMPVIRNNLIMMLSNLNYEIISTVAGKRKLQDEALTEIKSILLDKTGKEGVEEVYFTGFVMQ